MTNRYVDCAKCHKSFPESAGKCPHCGHDAQESRTLEARVYRYGVFGSVVGVVATIVLQVLLNPLVRLPGSIMFGVGAGLGAAIGVGLAYHQSKRVQP